MTSSRMQALWGALLFSPAVLLACNGEGKDDGEEAPLEDLVFEELGSFEVSDTGGYVDIDIEVPDGTVSSMAYCGGWGDRVLGTLWKLDNPGGSEVYVGDNADPNTYRSEYLDDMATALLPVTPNLDTEPGSWHFQWFVGAGFGGLADCEVVHRVDDVSDPATVIVDLVFVGVDGIDASTAPDDANVQAALAQFETEWGSGGVEVSYNYVDFSGDEAQFAVVNITGDDYSEFNNLLRKANPDNVRSITFFLVEEIAIDGSTVLGLSGGPPGAAAFNQTSKSGVVITTIDLEDAPEDVGKIMAHEGGHYLGLYHTSEADGGQHDPISDSPKCDASNDSDANGKVNTAECGGKGAENVMWWTLTSGNATLTADQSWVMRRNPIAD